jgi:anti-anti-sigma factor
MSLEATVTASNEGTVIHLFGELDMSTVETLRQTVQAELHAAPARVIIDISNLRFCDSLGLGTLVVLSRAARSQRTPLLLRHPSRFFLRMVEVAGVGDALTFAS